MNLAHTLTQSPTDELHGLAGLSLQLMEMLGSLVGALLLYLAGRAFGRQRMYAVVERLPLVNTSDLRRGEEWFARHGEKSALLGRMVPLVRSVISVPAGVEAMPVGRFVVLTALGSALWNSIFVLAGYLLGEKWGVVEPYADVLQKLVIVAVVAAVAVFVVRRVRSIRAR
ncbi:MULTISPECIES: DedA family protein [Rhodococcus]|uniref:DedA family protein n=1 Tax=Rhodococcus TaxID=1827 RepID=UPI001E434B92|nr:DedA family protein [Rhodococcus pyridinivorans]MCD2118891.1 DedA family protein [Rhodococcus pyridinivorans]MCZ4627921.1 DedA family protein [Rhodococcus pyridinivorans]MCZ4649048.1 DedA family protein [Rhodococcus pyridinivorans]MDJ0482011.1 DedA family protein [Rhodococcus pyridinivorans]MDV7255236.1 DedA family protein [Rhodococcus pyridinivorans]